MRIAAFAAVLALALGARPSASPGHQIPARRSVVVQAEPGSVAILVTWSAGNDLASRWRAARAVWGKEREAARGALEALAARRALAPLEMTAGSEPLEPANARVKLTGDPRTGAPLAAAVLVVAPAPEGTGGLTVALRSSEETSRLTWVDRSQGRALALPYLPEGSWLRDRPRLTLIWRAP